MSHPPLLVSAYSKPAVLRVLSMNSAMASTTPSCSIWMAPPMVVWHPYHFFPTFFHWLSSWFSRLQSPPPAHYFYCGKMGMKLTILTIVHVQFSGIHVSKPSPPSSYLSLASSVFICSTGLGGDLKKCRLDLAIFSLFKFFQDCRHLG